MDSETRLRASINGLAMKKVTRFFNATTEAIIGEMLQNARRAGATKVQITTEAEAVTIRDDGVGIAEPGQLLEFGSSGWSDQRTRAEDPAGMGFFSLARRNAEVESWPRNGAGGWRISLEPKHFTGEAEASVTRCGAANGPLPSGTRVTFEQKGNLYGLRNEIRKLCRYYPIPVVMDDERLPREHFLKGAVYKETTDGVEIGVFRSTVAYGVHLTVVNFHGHVIGNRQPVVIEPLHGYARATPEYWFTRVHVEHAPQLELVLPARNEVVSNDYWTELMVQCERAIYAAMAKAEPQPMLRHWDWRRAQSLGVTLQEPPARLSTWQPRKQEDRLRSRQQRTSRTTAVTRTETTRPMVMRAHVSPPEEHALARALRVSDTPLQLMADEPNLAGYRWYNDLEHVVEVQVYEETAGTRSVLPAHDEDENQPEHGTADRIVCVLRVRTSTGKIENIEITGDIGFRNSSGAGWPDEDIAVVVANDTTITSDELTTMMVEAFFDPSYDGDTESRNTQHELFEQECRLIATTLRVSEHEARKEHLTALGLTFGREMRGTENVRISRTANGTVDVDVTTS